MSLEKLLATINKTHGENSVSTVKNQPTKWPSIPTGILSLDYELGIGGIPRGRITEIYGENSSGKTSICMSVVANAQTNGELCAWIDAEHRMNPQLAERLNVQPDQLILNQPLWGEQGLQIALDIINSGEVSVVVIDSVAMLIPKCEVEGELEDSNIGSASKMMARAIRKLAVACRTSNCAVLLINQIRDNPGGWSPNGKPETTPGGRIIPFACSVRMKITRSTAIKKSSETIGFVHKFKIIKNDFRQELVREGSYRVISGEGADSDEQLVEICLDAGILTKNGNKILLEGEELGSSLPKTQDHVASNPDLIATLKNLLKESNA